MPWRCALQGCLAGAQEQLLQAALVAADLHETKLHAACVLHEHSEVQMNTHLSCSDMPVHAGEPTGMSPSLARYRLRLSLP